MKSKIGKHKAAQWQNFLMTIQQIHDNKNKMFWSYLSRIYKSRTLPFYKLLSGKKVLSEQEEITNALHKYYNEQLKSPLIDYADAHEVKIDSECKYSDRWKLAKIVTLNKLKTGVLKCDQTGPISLLAAHSKLFEKIVLNRVKYWIELHQLVSIEQSGSRPTCFPRTRMLSILQEIKKQYGSQCV
jgi:hypothetical protein